MTRLNICPFEKAENKAGQVRVGIGRQECLIKLAVRVIEFHKKSPFRLGLSRPKTKTAYEDFEKIENTKSPFNQSQNEKKGFNLVTFVLTDLHNLRL